ncbi:MAG: amidohydrolase [Acidobacteria bacterium]|nr:amidohydrolase [Acidobacteriota bacterium]
MSHRRREFLRRTVYGLSALPLAASRMQAALPSDLIRPEVIFHNGKILTANSRFDVVQALAVYEGKILALGTNDEIRSLAGPHSRLVDLEGRTAMPGLYDGHIHLSPGHSSTVQDWTHLKTRDELFQALKRRAAQILPDEWVYGYVSGIDLPNRWEIDGVVADRPVVVTTGAHVMTTNSLALRKAEVTSATPSPPGGRVVKNDKGEPTGRFEEMPAWRLMLKVVPPSRPDTDDQIVDFLEKQITNLLSLGITSANVAGIRLLDPNDPYRYQELNKIGPLQYLYARKGAGLPRLTVQLRVWPGYEYHEDPLKEGVEASIRDIESFGLHTGFGNDRLKIGALKMSIDGRGGFRIPAEPFYRVARRAHQLNWQLGIHASGLDAILVAVDGMEKILNEFPRANHRHYVHHFSVLPPVKTLETMARLHIGVSIQPQSSAGPAASGSQTNLRNPQKIFSKYGIPLGYGTDLPAWELVGKSAGRYDLFYGIWAAVTRKTPDGGVREPDERVSVGEAIRNYTWGAAYLNFDEAKVGSLEVGKAADLVVLNQDPLNVDPERIRDTKIVRTVLDGETVYSSQFE